MAGGVSIGDPILHTHVADELPEEHPLAFSGISCRACGTLVHAGNNECMTTWVETGKGAFCLGCFSQQCGSVVEDEFGLSGKP